MDRRADAWTFDLGLLLIRLILGVVFIFHGAQKLFGIWGGAGMEGFTGFLTSLEVPLPMVSAWLAALAEFGGGLLLLVGLATRLATIPLVITMLVAVLMVHRSAFSLQAQGMEYALTLAVVTAALGLMGPGQFSLDALIRGRRDGLDQKPVKG